MKQILVVGDACVDEYVYGTVSRLSPEAPVPVFVPSYSEEKSGMAGNVVSNLRSLGVDVVDVCGSASKKTRLIEINSKQHLLRIDHDTDSSPLTIEDIPTGVYSAVVVSDYNKGAITYELIEQLTSQFHCPIFIDTKKTDLARFDGCFVKINNKEYEAAKTYNNHLIVTHGALGASYNNRKYPARMVSVCDVCGAGDTFLAALTFKYIERDDIDDAMKFAIAASAITVQNAGVYAPSLKEIENEIKRNSR